jgi:glucose-1-phosphate cytidylyltransferase
MPVIILCGGRGTRMGPAGREIPKPMLPIGGRPVLWHIMNIYASQGHREFVLALGYLAEVIKTYFLNFDPLNQDFSIEVGAGARRGVTFLDAEQPNPPWTVTCCDTGLDSGTGTRVRRAFDKIDGGPVMVTYGDGVGDVDISALIEFHRRSELLATVTAVRPPGRFGELRIAGNGRVEAFEEKPQSSAGFIAGGFMIFEPEAITKYIPEGIDVMLEREPLSNLAADGQLAAYVHEGFWQPMDTPREHAMLDDLWESGEAPWRTW